MTGDDSAYPADRLSELFEAVDDAPRLARDAEDAPPELVETLRASATAWFLEWPEAKQMDFVERVTERERASLLAELPAEVRRRLLVGRPSEVGIRL